MDSDKIIQELNQRFDAPLPEFYKRRIVFWYDEDGEFQDRLDEITLNNAKLLALTDTNNFAVKKLLTVDDTTNNYLVYCPLSYEQIAQIAAHLLLTAATRTMRLEYLAGLDGWISSPHQAFCYDFISAWLPSGDQEQFSEIAKTGEDERKLPQRFMKLEVSDLVDTEIFLCLDEVILIKLMTEISDHVP